MILSGQTISEKVYGRPHNTVNFGAKPVPKNIALAFKNGLLDKSVSSIDIYCHTSPDEDTINCAKVLYKWLTKAGKKVSMCFNKDELKGLNIKPIFYNIRPKQSEIVPDRALCIDFNGFERVPRNYDKSILKNEIQNIFCIDHHSKASSYINSPNMYVDNSSYSCSGIVYRFFEAIGEKLSKKDMKSLYCGMLSDYRKSKLIKFENNSKGVFALRKPMLLADKNSVEVLDNIEKSLSSKDKTKICRHLDVMSTLTQKEQEFTRDIASTISVNSQNFAYIFIDPKDSKWASLGMGTRRNRDILKDLRLRLLNGLKDDNLFTDNQKKQFKNLKAAAVFYRVSNSNDSVFKMSIHSKEGYAEKLTNYVKTNLNSKLVAGGHPDRQGSTISSINYDDVYKFVNDFLVADDALLKKTHVI